MNVYQPGDSVLVEAQFQNNAQVDADPPAVRGKFRTNMRVITIYIYNIDVELIRDAAGAYHFVIHIPNDFGLDGIWRWRFEGEDALGNSLAAIDGSFRVQSTEFF